MAPKLTNTDDGRHAQATIGGSPRETLEDVLLAENCIEV